MMFLHHININSPTQISSANSLTHPKEMRESVIGYVNCLEQILHHLKQLGSFLISVMDKPYFHPYFAPLTNSKNLRELE